MSFIFYFLLCSCVSEGSSDHVTTLPSTTQGLIYVQSDKLPSFPEVSDFENLGLTLAEDYYADGYADPLQDFIAKNSLKAESPALPTAPGGQLPTWNPSNSSLPQLNPDMLLRPFNLSWMEKPIAAAKEQQLDVKASAAGIIPTVSANHTNVSTSPDPTIPTRPAQLTKVTEVKSVSGSASPTPTPLLVLEKSLEAGNFGRVAEKSDQNEEGSGPLAEGFERLAAGNRTQNGTFANQEVVYSQTGNR